MNHEVSHDKHEEEQVTNTSSIALREQFPNKRKKSDDATRNASKFSLDISKKMRKPGFGLGLNRNHYFIFGFLLGLVLSFYIPENVWDLVQSECPQLALENNLIEKFGEDFEPHLNLINKPLAAKKPKPTRAYNHRHCLLRLIN
uniref:Uncharacterized protein n=1 Tax=Megaselia scalaris TaxID=36166 RepID=T1GEV1_MEGSC